MPYRVIAFALRSAQKARERRHRRQSGPCSSASRRGQSERSVGREGVRDEEGARKGEEGVEKGEEGGAPEVGREKERDGDAGWRTQAPQPSPLSALSLNLH